MNIVCVLLLGCVGFRLSDGCPSGYTEHKQSCYRVSHDAKPWTEAMAVCKGENGYLAEVTSEDENQFLMKLSHPPAGSKYRWYAVYFIGGNNLDVRGQWVWEMSHHALTYTNWRYASSNSARGCLVINTNDAKWNHINCNLDTGYICEQPV